MNKGCILARAPGGQMQGAAMQAMRCHRRGAATQILARSDKPDARPPPRPVGLRPAGPLAALLALYMQPGMAGPPDPVLVARALPAGLGACSKMQPLFITRP